MRLPCLKGINNNWWRVIENTQYPFPASVCMHTYVYTYLHTLRYKTTNLKQKPSNRHSRLKQYENINMLISKKRKHLAENYKLK